MIYLLLILERRKKNEYGGIQMEINDKWKVLNETDNFVRVKGKGIVTHPGTKDLLELFEIMKERGYRLCFGSEYQNGILIFEKI